MKATRSWLLVALLTAWSCLSFADLEEAEDYETAGELRVELVLPLTDPTPGVPPLHHLGLLS